MRPDTGPAAELHDIAGDSRLARAPQRILVIRLGAMGDVVHALIAVTALRRVLPRAHIGWLIEERWKSLLCATGVPEEGPCFSGRPLVNAVQVVDTKRWRASVLSRSTWRSALNAIAEVRHCAYEVTIDFQGALKSAVLGALSGVTRRFGFRQTRERPASLFYTNLVDVRGRHVVDRNLYLASRVAGTTLNFTGAALPLDDAAENRLEEDLARRGLRDFALIVPGAGWGAKQWPAERYGEVASALSGLGIRSVVTFAPGEESLARKVVAHSANAAEMLTCGVGELIALTRRARLFIGGDTGPMHLAAALRTPVVAIFGPTDPARNGPYGTFRIVLRDSRSATSYSHVDHQDEGLRAISPAAVIHAAKRLLGVQGGSGV